MPDVKRAELMGVHRVGRFDPTMTLSDGDCWRAASTPDGPGTLHVWRSGDGWDAEGYGPGGIWLMATVPHLCGEHDDVPTIEAHHQAVAVALTRHDVPVLSASRLVWPALVYAILGQRVTGKEGVEQWSALCRAFSSAAPGPVALRLPPDADQLAKVPYWALHRMGIERRRADTLRAVARHRLRIERLGLGSIDDTTRLLGLINGVGPWTVAETVVRSHGDPDAVSVGDYHLKNIVSYALAGEPRGTDERC